MSQSVPSGLLPRFRHQAHQCRQQGPVQPEAGEVVEPFGLVEKVAAGQQQACASSDVSNKALPGVLNQSVGLANFPVIQIG